MEYSLTMSDTAVPAGLSRPKIHRPPVVAREEPPPHRLVAAVLSYGNTARFIFTLSSLVLGFVLLALLVSHSFPGALKENIVAKADISPSAGSPPPSETIVLRNENDVIVGQMARIASPVQPGPEISTMSSAVDRRKGQELLSIIGKY
jgi:hypothetical protein